MGKTQTVLKYVELYKSEYNYRVRWIDAESKVTIDAAYRKFAEYLEIDIEKKSDEEIAILVKTMLEKKMKHTLLIFDNVQDRALIKTYTPSLTGRVKHHVLITTRSTIGYGIHPKINYEDVIRLTPFTKQEALDYIRISLEE